MNNNSEQIGRYLQNEMTAEEKTAFEKQLAADKELKQELFIQERIIDAAKTIGLKNAFGKAVKRKFISKRLIQFGVGAIILVAAAFVFYAIKNNLFNGHESGDQATINTSERITINNAADTIIETNDGVVFAIPAHAFDSKSGKVQLEIRTAIKPYDIMRQGLSTESNGSLLQTAGMFYINGYENGKPVGLVKNIDVSVPTNKINPNMKLFDGVMDSSGRINWVDPKPIENNLRTYDITTLDFYPPNYIPALKALEKVYTNKKYTDSLYYSFSGYRPGYPARAPGYKAKDTTAYAEGESENDFIEGSSPVELDGSKIFSAKCGSCHIMGKVFTGPNLQGVRSRWDNVDQLKAWILNWNKAVKAGYPRAVEVQNWSVNVEQVFEGSLKEAELESLIKWIDEWKGSADQRPDTSNKDYVSRFHYEIDPSRIRAIWDKKFNNTLLATKEFEERLRYMHSLCSSDGLELYVKWIDKPMYEIDQYIADRTDHHVREKFLEFAARKDGRVILKEGMQEKLSAYFEKKYKAYSEAVKQTRIKYEAELSRLNQIADNKRREQETKDFLRDSKNFNEEFCINLTNAYDQIGIKRRCDDTIPPPPPTNYYNVTIDTVGWKNLDVYVLDATTNRESMTYTDPVTGKTASLTYKEVSITIKDIEQFDNVLIYLIPDSLSSFQRIEQQETVFKENMNSLFRYDVVAIGYKGDKIFYYKQENLQPGQYTFSLTSITEKELKGHLQKYSGEKSNELKTEFEYQLFEQQEIMRYVQLRKDDEFREKIAVSIFSCNDAGPWIVIPQEESKAAPTSTNSPK